MYTKISLKKIVDTPVAGDKMPSHAIIASDETYQNKVTVGKLWFKKGDYGNYLSGELSKNQTGKDGKEYKGYVIITQDEYDSLKGKSEPINVQVGTGEVDPSSIDF